jgi:hypothetical protein
LVRRHLGPQACDLGVGLELRGMLDPGRDLVG